MKVKCKRNRSKRRHIPGGAVIYPDGGWFYKYSEEELATIKMPIGCMFGPPIGYGELVCTND